MKIEIDKPVIPQFVADYLCRAKADVTLMRVMELANTRDERLKWEKEYDWISANDETFATAWIYGYEVEEEQKYNVKFKVKSSSGTVGIFLYKAGYEVLAGDNFRAYYPKEDEYRLTEKEIRGFQNGDILFEHFAVRV
ncbi:DUF1642 domain-containing protein [Aerococcus viridans]